MSVLVGCLRVEADRLGLAVIGLRSFNPRASVHKLAIPHIYSRIRETAVTSFSVRLNQGPITVLYALPSRFHRAMPMLGRMATSQFFWVYIFML
jgi:hypothetical protein